MIQTCYSTNFMKLQGSSSMLGMGIMVRTVWTPFCLLRCSNGWNIEVFAMFIAQTYLLLFSTSVALNLKKMKLQVHFFQFHGILISSTFQLVQLSLLGEKTGHQKKHCRVPTARLFPGRCSVAVSLLASLTTSQPWGYQQPDPNHGGFNRKKWDLHQDK